MFSPERYLAALRFAAEKHLQQKFPGSEQPREVWIVKLADRIANMDAPPHYWTAEKRVAYRQEALVIADSLGSASSVLDPRLRACIAAYPA